jgi:crotonobetainyl-CoA:carnitine CoA-transferase CaiB-like acyl-CoA transferase
MTDHSVTADSLLPVAATGPLAGVRVLDLVSVVMGPYATQILGDLGAEVISLEVAGGDPLRVIGRGVHPQLSGAALNVLRNKRNASINLKSPEGHEAFMRLAASCDVFVTNLRPQALEKLGLGYAAVAAAKPDIIYCEAHGFSSDGPRSQEAAYDDIIQASSGIVDLMGSVRERPALAPMILADKLSGLTIVYAVTAALYCRAKTGQGQRIEVPMHDAVASFVLVEHGADAIVQPPQGDPGYQRLLAPNHRPYTTADGGVLVVIPYSPKNWLDLFAAGGRTLLRTTRDWRAMAVWRRITMRSMSTCPTSSPAALPSSGWHGVPLTVSRCRRSALCRSWWTSSPRRRTRSPGRTRSSRRRCVSIRRRRTSAGTPRSWARTPWNCFCGGGLHRRRNRQTRGRRGDSHRPGRRCMNQLTDHACIAGIGESEFFRAPGSGMSDLEMMLLASRRTVDDAGLSLRDQSGNGGAGAVASVLSAAMAVANRVANVVLIPAGLNG